MTRDTSPGILALSLWVELAGPRPAHDAVLNQSAFLRSVAALIRRERNACARIARSYSADRIAADILYRNSNLGRNRTARRLRGKE